MLPVPGPGFLGRFCTGSGRKADANGPKTGPKVPGPSARAVWDCVLFVRMSFPAQNWPWKLGSGTGGTTIGF